MTRDWLRRILRQARCRLLHKADRIHLPACCADSGRQEHLCWLKRENWKALFGTEDANGWVRSDPYCARCEMSLR